MLKYVNNLFLMAPCTKHALKLHLMHFYGLQQHVFLLVLTLLLIGANISLSHFDLCDFV